MRKSLIGSGDRSERVRTYNFPQGRVTDHRINLTLYKIDKILSGEVLDEIVDALSAADRAQKLSMAAAQLARLSEWRSHLEPPTPTLPRLRGRGSVRSGLGQ